MTDETGFFQFDTNLGAIVAEIEQGMARINRATSRAGSVQQTNIDIEGLSGFFANARQGVEGMQREMRGLIQQVGNRQITPAEFRTSARNLVQGTMTGMQESLRQEFRNIPQSTLRTLDFRQMMGQVLNDVYGAAAETLRTYRPEANGLLKGVALRQPGQLMSRIFDKPFGAGPGDPIGYLQYQQFLEGLVHQAPGGRSKVVGGIADRLGISSELERLRQQMVIRDLDGNIVGVRKTSTKADLQELLSDERAGIAVNREYERSTERAAASLNGAAAAAHTFDQRLEALRNTQRAARGEFGDALPSGSYLDRRSGRAYVPGMGGLVVGDANQTAKVRAEVDKLAESKAKLATEEEHYQRIMAEGRQVGGSNIYRTPDGGFFRDLGGGRATQLEGLEYTRAFHRYNTELDQLGASTQRLSRAREQEAIREVRNNSGFTGGFLSRFHRNEMSPIVALGQQVGSAAAFSAAYGSLFALQGGIRDTIAEFQDYQDSMTDLQVATRNSDMVTNQWVNDLSELARLSGSNVGAAMDAAARGVRAFTDPLKDSQATIQATGDATAEAATKLALIANKDLRDATGDIVAVGSAYQLQGDQLNEIVDAVANAKRNLGGDPAQIAQGLALIAGAAQEAGYSMTEAASVIGIVQAQTDQSGQAIATRLSRVFQIVSGSTGKALAAEMGIDPNLSAKRQLEAYSKIFTDPETSKAKQDRILSALGGTANRREVLAVLRNGDRLARSYADAFKNAGAGTAEFERKTHNLIGTLKKLTTDIKNIQVDLARTGLFAPLGAAVDVIEPALHGLDLLIKLVDRLTGQSGAVQKLAFSLLDVVVAAKAIGAIQAKRALFAAASSSAGADVAGEVAAAQLAAMRAGATKAEVAAIGVATRERLAAEEAMDAAIIGSAERRAAAEAAGAGAAASGGIRAGLASIWGFLKKPTSLIGLGLIAGGYGISKLYDQHTAATAFQRDATTSSLAAYAKSDGSSEALAATAGTLNSLFGKVKNSASQGASGVQAAAAKLIHTRSQEVLALAKLTAAEEKRAAAANKITAFGTGAIETTTELAKGMETIAAGGGTALTQIRALRKALSTPPTPGKEIFAPQRTANDVRDALMNSLGASVPDHVQGYRFDVTDKPWNPSSGLPVPATVPSQNKAGGVMPYSYLNKQEAEQAILANNTDKQIDAIVKQKIRELGLQGKTNITAEQKRRLLKATLDSMDFSQFTTASKEIVDAWYKNALKKLRMPVAAGGVDPSLLNSKHRTVGQVESILNGSQGEDGTKYVGFAQAMQDALGAIPRSDDGTMKRAELRAQVTFLQGLKRSLGGKQDANLDLLLANTVHDFRASEVEQAEALRTAGEAHAKNNKQLREIRLRLAKVSIRKAGNDIPLLISIMQNLDRRTIEALLDYQRTAITLVQQARQHTLSLIHAAQQILESGNIAAGTQGGDYLMHGQATDNPDAVDKADRQGKRIKRMQKHLNAMEKAYSQATVSDATATVPSGGGGSGSGQSAAEKHAELVAAKASAEAARRGGNLAQARAQIVSAAAQMQAAKRGTADWYNALASWYSARQSLSDAILQYRYTLDQLHGDTTNPVENARDSLRNARRTLATHRAQGRGADVLASDRLAVRQAETQLESEKFNQRLQDVQTADQLGRISHRKYLEYLDHEHDRLSRIKHRTRQQQDELNQVDQAMKDAVSQMQGQFNLGDIDVRGLVYSSRRYAAEVKAGHASMQVSHSASVNQTVTIQIDGADVGKVRKIIDEYVGGSATLRTTKPRRA